MSILGGIILLIVKVYFANMDDLGKLSDALPAGAIGLGFVLCMLGLEVFSRARMPRSRHRDNEEEEFITPVNDNRGTKVPLAKRKQHAFLFV